MQYHEPVLLKETIAGLNVKKGKTYIDCTLGDGGHSIEILKKGGNVLGIDYSDESLERAIARIKETGLEKNFVGVIGNFKNIDEIAQKVGFNQIDGVLYDLGYSSYQLDDGLKGLSFQKNEPLDMRLEKSLQVTAADLLNTLSEKDLSYMIFAYSDERYARKIARAIVETRKMKKFHTTKDLVDLIVSVTPPGYELGRINPATRTFQALRIVVNDELSNLEISLPRAARLLLPGGRMIIISFHSLEDQIVKKFGFGAQPQIKVITKKPLIPSESEIKANARSRSAKMRIFEK